MNFVDTSVIVRYLLGDTEPLFTKAKTILEQDADLTVTDVVLAEVFYVLSSVYKVPRAELIDVLIMFIQRHTIMVSGLAKEVVVKALLLCRPSGRVSLPDALLWAAAISADTEVATVYSFDARFPGEGVDVRAEL